MALSAAQGLIADRGLPGLSARAVASAIGYTPGTLYLVFRNLDDLILNVNAASLDTVRERLEACARAGDVRSRVPRIGRAYVAFALESPGRWSALYEHRMASEAVPDWYLARITRCFEPLERSIAALDPSRDAGEVARAARALWGGVNGICALGLTGKLALTGDVTVEDLADSLVSHFVAGWCAAGNADPASD